MTNTDYQIDLATGSLLVAAGKIIEGNGALIYDTTTHGKLLTLVPGALNADTGMLAGGWQIGDLRLRGAFVSTFDNAGYGIYVTGTDNVGSGTAPVYVESFLLDNISINDVANSGIWEIFTDGGIRQNVKMQDIGYTGLMALSCRHLRVKDSRVVNLGPGTGANAYGFAFTRTAANTLTTAPRSSDCVIDEWFVKNNPIWHAVDTHGGEGIKILNGRAEDVFRGINAGYDADGANARGALHCVIKNNTLVGIAVGSTKSNVGIMHVGYPSALDGYNFSCVVEGNHIEHFGDVSSATLGGIFLQGTVGVCVQGNSIVRCRSVGISFAGFNHQAIARDNYVEDAHSDTLAAGIGVFNTNNEITFGPNRFKKTGTAYGTSNIPYGYLTSNSATYKLNFEGGDQAAGLSAGSTYNIGANVVAKYTTWTTTKPS